MTNVKDDAEWIKRWWWKLMEKDSSSDEDLWDGVEEDTKTMCLFQEDAQSRNNGEEKPGRQAVYLKNGR